jgi:hypothetical protein
MQVILSTLGGVLLSVEYDSTGLAWCRLYDNQIVGWEVDDTGAGEPQPQIIGQLPTLAPDTAPVLSPQWGAIVGPGGVFAGYPVNPPVLLPGGPGAWRGPFEDFLDWLATNNGAQRRLESRLSISAAAINSFNRWAGLHPTGFSG